MFRTKKPLPIQISFIILLFPALLLGADWYVDSGVSYRNLYDQWGVGDMPPQPSAFWWLADTTGTDYDTVDATVDYFRNRGGSTLTNPLINGNQPTNLTESPVAPHQSACVFDGNNDYLYINDANILDVTTGNVSVACWFYTTTPATAQVIVGKKVSGAAGYALVVSSSKLIFTIYSSGANTATGTTTLLANKWYFGVGTWCQNATLDSTTVYLNGVLEDTTGLNQGSITTTNKVAVGALSDVGFPFAGGISCVMFWKGTALSAAQVAALYTAMAATGAADKPFPSMQFAHNASTAADNIYVASGRYQETVVDSKGLNWLQNPLNTTRPELYGAVLCGLTGTPAGTTALILTAAAKVIGFDIRGWYSAGSYGVDATNTSDGALIGYCTFDSCLTAIRLTGNCNNDSLVNCTIDGASLASCNGLEMGGWTGTSPMMVLNNIFVNCDTAAVNYSAAGSLTFNYNDFSGNTVNVAYLITEGASDRSVPPMFRGQAANDYVARHPLLFRKGLAWRAYSPVHIGAYDVLYVGGETGREWARNPWGR